MEANARLQTSTPSTSASCASRSTAALASSSSPSSRGSAKIADTSTPEGRVTMLREVALTLRRLRDAWVYGGAVNEPMRALSSQKEVFDRYCNDARARYREETVRNEQGVKTATPAGAYTPRTDEGAGLILVSIIVAARRELYTVQADRQTVRTSRSALEARRDARREHRSSRSRSSWQPSEDNDRMSSMELEAKYPRPEPQSRSERARRQSVLHLLRRARTRPSWCRARIAVHRRPAARPDSRRPGVRPGHAYARVLGARRRPLSPPPSRRSSRCAGDREGDRQARSRGWPRGSRGRVGARRRGGRRAAAADQGDRVRDGQPRDPLPRRRRARRRARRTSRSGSPGCSAARSSTSPSRSTRSARSSTRATPRAPGSMRSARSPTRPPAISRSTRRARTGASSSRASSAACSTTASIRSSEAVEEARRASKGLSIRTPARRGAARRGQGAARGCRAGRSSRRSPGCAR